MIMTAADKSTSAQHCTINMEDLSLDTKLYAHNNYMSDSQGAIFH